MFNIITVTIKFDPLEDRIIMDCYDPIKKTQRLWLTKRLLDKLIPKISNQLKINSVNNISEELEQSFEQEKAELNQKETDPVELKEDFPSLLVTSVQVNKNKSNFQIIFHDERKLSNLKNNFINKAQFILAIANLRLWLKALLRIYKKADWDTKNFPSWLNKDFKEEEKKLFIN